MRVAVGLASICVASIAFYASDAQLPASNAGGCELHFWGSNNAMTSNYSGVGGVLGAALSGPSPQNRENLVSDLPTSAQEEALRAVDLAALLRMPDVHVVPEHEAIDRKLVKSSSARLTNSIAPCYAELIVDYIGYTSHITAGRKFGARFWLRRYPNGSGPAQVQNGGKDVKLTIYPAKKPEDHPAALTEVRVAFGKVTEGFLLNKVR